MYYRNILSQPLLKTCLSSFVILITLKQKNNNTITCFNKAHDFGTASYIVK